MQNKNGEINTNYVEVVPRRVEVIYTRKTRERKIYMDELKEVRKRRHKRFIRRIVDSIGPSWYYELSEPQRRALDTLEFSIYQDVLEGRPSKTEQVIRKLGLHPRPYSEDVMYCVYTGRKDPKQMLANLFGLMYGHSIEGKRADYNLNAKLLLSAILYLGRQNLINLLQNKFHVEPEQPKEPKPEVKIKSVQKSPYLEEMIAVLYKPPTPKPQRPPPLPNFDSFNEPYEEEPIIRKPPPLPPPPPPPKKRLPRSYCDKLAGIMSIEPKTSIDKLSMKPIANTNNNKRTRSSKISILEDRRRSYGIGTSVSKKVRRKKPVAPTTGMKNAQYLIQGVYTVNGKTVFVLGNVSLLPPDGDMIHGGYTYVNGECINIHCGYRGRPPPPKPDPCDCVTKWQDSVFKYIEDTKCYCDHYYDFGNEGAFMPDELPYFEKPTRNAPFRFNYDTIYNLDDKQLHVQKEFRKLWGTDSMLRCNQDSNEDKKDKRTKSKTKKHSATSLNEKVKPEEYLRSALRTMRRENVAARLPDIHLVPELKEWMRHRIHGPYTPKERSRILHKSINDWQKFWTLSLKGYGHVYPSKDSKYTGHTNWVHKHELNQNFRKYTHKYKLELFKSFAKFNNMLWPTMCQAQFPDKKFREIYYSYLYGRVEDLVLIHPYSVTETAERKRNLENKRYSCLRAIERTE
ncbi:unnamed protein product [Parnassius mnemosyne]|uniref:DUF4771 domain-containing protein n=1 Tax=Parnassius mnemosyne TaxID=213953 RepID=A0AAV1LZB2_9NEOP